MAEEVKPPKLFISYAWSSPDHEQWVLDLAHQLVESGIDVVLDKWDLKEGDDANAFMEQMVTNEEVTKVIMVFDKKYQEKTNSRTGGVGTEAQIISSEVYAKQKQNKFVAILAEVDESGNEYVPAYYKGRIFINLSTPEKYDANFEQLLRWIFDKPLYVKPELGKRPSFLEETDQISLGTRALFNRAISAIKENKPYANGALQEYLETFATNIERFRIDTTTPGKELDDLILESIEKFLPFRGEMIKIFTHIAQYAPTEDNILKIHRFFESFIPYHDRPENTYTWHKQEFDNFKFITQELFLYFTAILIKYEQYSLLNKFLTKPYYIAHRDNNTILEYPILRNSLDSLVIRNNRLSENRISIHSDLIIERTHNSGFKDRDLMQADLVLYLRSQFMTNCYWGWFPDSLLYHERCTSSLEIFARAISKAYFDEMKCILNVTSKQELSDLISKQLQEGNVPKWRGGWQQVNITKLTGIEKLATHP